MIPKAIKPEYLSEDILEDFFINSFKLVCLIQTCIGSCRVQLKDRFVTAPTKWQKLYTACLLVLSILMFFTMVVTYFENFHSSNMLYYLVLISMGIHMAVCYLSTIHARFINGKDNAEFYLRMQKIDRLMNIDRNIYMNGLLRRVNIITGTVICTSIPLILLVACVNNGTIAVLGFVGTALAQGTFMLELAFCSNLVLFYFLRLRFVNCIIHNHLKQHVSKPLPQNYLRFPTKKVLRNVAALTHNFTTCETDMFLKEIFESFTTFQNIYKFQVFIYFARVVLHSIISFEVILIGLQIGILAVFDIAVICVFVLLDILIIAMLCIRLEMFFRQVKETKRLSISIMSVYQEGELREKARTMYKMVEDSPPRFSVYGMWQVEAGVLLQLFMLITTIIVTLIQFHIL